MKVKKLFLAGFLCLSLITFALADGETGVGPRADGGTGGETGVGPTLVQSSPALPSIVEQIINFVTGG